jgi:hypothetical protein
VVVPIAAAICGLGMLQAAAPAYLAHQGFPLDDAWIHAVYARELARTGVLAYNPGVPATGETSPLWAIVLAGPHRLAGAAEVVAATKMTGFALHAASAVLIAIAVRSSSVSRWLPAAVGAIVALHPDLLAASVSGMEVPLATLAIGASAYAAVGQNAALAAAAGGAAFLARPETAVFAVLCPGLYSARGGTRRTSWMAAAAIAGSLAAVAVVAARNLSVSGRPLPATFYAKASIASPISMAWQRVGFTQVFASMPVVGAPVVLLGLALVSTWMLLRTEATGAARLGATLALGGLAFCVVSFALIRPLDPGAFYHQRYVLPAVLPILASIPLLTAEITQLRLPYTRLIQLTIGVAIAALLIAGAPGRYRRLSNDARNIDDVQVAFGRALSGARATDAAWVVDAGAVRYFGAPFVVDLMALNTFELLTPDAQSFLDHHPPRYLDVFNDWSTVRMDDGGGAPRRRFSVSTPYTVTSFPYMGQHTLVTCEPPGRRGVVALRVRTFLFTCAPADVSLR